MDTKEPHTIIESLDTVRRRLNWMSIGISLSIAVVSFTALLLLIILIDYLLNLSAAPRLVLIFAGMVAMGYVLWRWVIESAVHPLTLNDIASRVERLFPQYQDRLISTLNFLEAKHADGSQIMRERVVGEATRIAVGLDMSQVIRTRPLWLANIAGASAVLLLATLWITVNPAYLQIARSRLLTPFSATLWPRAVVISQVGNLSSTAAQGQGMPFEVRLSRGDKTSRKVLLHYQYVNEQSKPIGPVQDLYMTRGSDGIYRSFVDARMQGDNTSGKLNVWADSGDGSLAFDPIKVVPRLALKQVEAVISAPAYASQAPLRVNLDQNPVTVVAGSKLKLIATFNKPLDQSCPLSIEVVNSKAQPIFQPQTPMQDSAAVELLANESFHFHLRAKDIDGLPNLAAEEFEVIVRADQLPTCTIQSPQINQDCTPEASLPMKILAEDDLGISSLNWVATRLGDKATIELPLVQQGAAIQAVQWNSVDPAGSSKRFEAQYAWELSSVPGLSLRPGDELECYASVADNYLLNDETHPRVSSQKLRISIISQEAFSNKIADEMNAVSEQVSALKQTQAQAMKDTSDLSAKLATSVSIDSADKAMIERITESQNSIALETKSLAGKLGEMLDRMEQNKSTNRELRASTKEVGQILNNASESSMKEATASLTVAGQSNQRSEDIHRLADAQAAQSEAAKNLQSALDRIGKPQGLSQTVQNLQNLLKDQQALTSDTAKATQETLGKTVDELTPQQRDKLGELAKAQTDLVGKTRKALDEMSRNARALARTDSTAAKAMTQAGNTAAAEDVVGQQTAAADATRQNQQTQAQTAQQQAESGLKTMLDQLQQGQQQKQAELAKQVDEKLQGLDALIQQQASCNLGNLALQGGSLPDRVAALGQSELFSQAGQDPNALPPAPTFDSLISAQNQTEHDARELANSTQSSPDGTDAGEHLIKAADSMKQACGSLRDHTLAEAFDPAQTVALNELLAAKKTLEKQKQEDDADKQEEEKKTIKQAYADLLVLQEQVNSRTIALDAMPRKPDGTLRRQDLIRLAQLTPMQKAVTDGAMKLDEPLSKLGSIVYSWANKDLVKNMTQVQQLLEEKQIGSATQARQRQVVAQLNAIINDLALKPRKKPPSSKPEGKGGEPPPAGGPPDMPTEAEVRLMLDLQVALNQSTLELSQLPRPDRADLVAVGNRQGELRNLLDQLLRKASKGKTRLRPETDATEQLPEESAGSTTKPSLKDDEPSAEDLKDLNLIGTRMIRVKQRLSVDADAGRATQAIQSRIVDNLNTLLQRVRKNVSPKKDPPPHPKPKPKKKQDSEQMQSGVDLANSNSKGKGASSVGLSKSSSGSGGDGTPGQPGSDLAKQQDRMWGTVTPKERDAVIESQTETVLDKYKHLVDDYYRAMSTQEDAH